MTDGCPCDTCRFKKDNYKPPNQCPNFEYFFDAMMMAYDGVLKTDACEKWEAEECRERDRIAHP